ncbi:MAG: histidine kinase [Flavobacteriia bacterium]|nr:histidine kinase [Flavobacteriia bacterium]
MKIALIGLFFLATAHVSFGQKKCDCQLVEDFVKRRDFDAVTAYQEIQLLKESKTFEKSKNTVCKSYAVHLKAVHAIRSGNYEWAKILLDREKFMLDSIHCKGINFLENSISYGDYFLRVGSYESAIEYYNKAYKILARQDNKTLQAHVLLSLSNAQSKINQEDRARTYLNQAHPLVLLLPNGQNKVESLYNLSARYYYQFQVTNDVALLDSAEHMATFGIELARTIKYTEGFIRGYNLLEDKQYHEKNYRQALIYLDSALYFTLPEIHASERLGIYSDMADIYLELKKYDKAYNCADSSLTYAKQVANPYKVKNALELLYNCSKLSGEYERALTVYEDLVLMRDSVLKIENNKLFSELEDKYHRVRKEKTESEYEQDRKLLTKQREIGNLRSKLITVGIVISALLLFYIIIIFRQKNIRSKQKRLEVEQRLQRARINPDFIYKALNNLQKMAVDDPTNTAIAKKLASFTKLMKQTLDSSHDDFLTLDKEIDFLTYYMELQRDRLKQRFVFSFEVDEQLNQSDVCLPTMILQPFIESTIEQGFKNLDHEGQITISFKQQQNELRIRIDDNGKGLKSVSSARASEIINDRFYLLNKMNKTSASYLIRERNSGGVQVEIFLPLITREMAESRRKDD